MCFTTYSLLISDYPPSLHSNMPSAALEEGSRASYNFLVCGLVLLYMVSATELLYLLVDVAPKTAGCLMSFDWNHALKAIQNRAFIFWVDGKPVIKSLFYSWLMPLARCLQAQALLLSTHFQAWGSCYQSAVAVWIQILFTWKIL